MFTFHFFQKALAMENIGDISIWEIWYFYYTLWICLLVVTQSRIFTGPVAL